MKESEWFLKTQMEIMNNIWREMEDNGQLRDDSDDDYPEFPMEKWMAATVKKCQECEKVESTESCD